MSAYFIDSTSRITIPTGSYCDLPAGGWSLGVWVKILGSGEDHQHYIYHRSGVGLTQPNTASLRITESNNIITSAFWDSNSPAGGATSTTVAHDPGSANEWSGSGWFHIVWQTSRGEAASRTGNITRYSSLYVNGQLVGTDSQDGMIGATGLNFILGRRGDVTSESNLTITGCLAEFCKFNRVLSKTEIAQLYNGHDPKLLSNGPPAVYYPLRNDFIDKITGRTGVQVGVLMTGDHPIPDNYYHPINDQQNSLPQLDGRVGKLEGRSISGSNSILNLENRFISGSFVPTGLVAGATANNSNIIGNWINTYGQALIPTGEWYISNKINVTKNNAKLYGPGTIKGQAGFNDTAIVNLLGTGCSVEDLTLDGSIADTAGGSIVLNLGGGHCFARNITITGTPHHGISMLGNRTLVDGCRIYGRTGVGSAINCSSYHTTVRDTYIENWGRQGIGLDQPRNGDNESFALVDNCRIVLNASGENGESKAGILIDTGVSTSGYSHVVIKNTNVIFEIAPSIASNVVKFALGHKVTVENCNFYTRATGLSISCGMRIAEGVNHLKITNTYISPGILWEDNALPDGERFTENVYLDNCKLGNFTRPFHSGYRAIESIRASNVIINGCQMKVSGIASAILTDTGNFRRLEVTNCIISGYRDGNTFSALFLSSGGLYHRTRSLYWNNNILGYQGDNSSFTASSPTSRFLQTANADGNRYFISGIPAGHNNVPTGVVGFWQIEFNQGDRIINTGVVKVGTTLEWVCVTGGIGSGNGVWLPVVTL